MPRPGYVSDPAALAAACLPSEADSDTPSLSLPRARRASKAGWRADETAAELFSRLAQNPLQLPCLPNGLHAGEVIEVFGEPGTGKTAVLMGCILQCIMPERFDRVPVGGHGEHAALLDTDGSFDPIWLGAALHARFLSAAASNGGSSSVSPSVDAAARRFASECMDRLHVVRCSDRSQLLCSLYALPQLVGGGAPAGAEGGGTGASCRPRKLRMLIIDSMSSFQWVERASARHSQPAGSQFDEQVSILLRQLLIGQQMCAVWSRCPATSHGAGREFPMQSGAPPSWSGLATHRLDLKRAEGAPQVLGAPRLAARLLSFSTSATHQKVAAQHKPRFDLTIRQAGPQWQEVAV